MCQFIKKGIFTIQQEEKKTQKERDNTEKNSKGKGQHQNASVLYIDQ